MDLLVRLLGLADLEPTLDHLERHLAENGRGETLLFGPRAPGTLFANNAFRARIAEAWARPIGAPDWGRTWGAVAEDGRVVGHADIRARSEPSTAHRALTSMGVEEGFRRRGIGYQLLTTAIAWAESQNQLVWLDLFHFEHNAPAAALYRKLEFAQVSKVVDMFRVAGTSVTDVFMSKKLR